MDTEEMKTIGLLERMDVACSYSQSSLCRGVLDHISVMNLNEVSHEWSQLY